MGHLIYRCDRPHMPTFIFPVKIKWLWLCWSLFAHFSNAKSCTYSVVPSKRPIFPPPQKYKQKFVKLCIEWRRIEHRTGVYYELCPHWGAFHSFHWEEYPPYSRVVRLLRLQSAKKDPWCHDDSSAKWCWPQNYADTIRSEVNQSQLKELLAISWRTLWFYGTLVENGWPK